MKIFSTLLPVAPEYVALAGKEWGIEPITPPQEDFLLVSRSHPIFCVADGVTLIQNIIDRKPYPRPSPTGEVAKIFCETVISIIEERFEVFNEGMIKEVFQEANVRVGEFNRAHGRTKETIDYWDLDFYAATAAFAVVKGSTVYWGSICDSFVAQVSQTKPLFVSPQCHELKESARAEYPGDANKKDRAMFVWRERRNALDAEGKRIGYGVVTGEENANRYLTVGTLSLGKGDSLALYTDGFEEFVLLPEFWEVFSRREEKPQEFSLYVQNKISEDPQKFGHEKSLIVVTV